MPLKKKVLGVCFCMCVCFGFLLNVGSYIFHLDFWTDWKYLFLKHFWFTLFVIFITLLINWSSFWIGTIYNNNSNKKAILLHKTKITSFFLIRLLCVHITYSTKNWSLTFRNFFLWLCISRLFLIMRFTYQVKVAHAIQVWVVMSLVTLWRQALR